MLVRDRPIARRFSVDPKVVRVSIVIMAYIAVCMVQRLCERLARASLPCAFYWQALTFGMVTLSWDEISRLLALPLGFDRAAAQV